MKLDKNQLHSLEISRIRDEQKTQGMFDGRFKTKSVRLKNKYTRKDKHKNQKYAA